MLAISTTTITSFSNLHADSFPPVSSNNHVEYKKDHHRHTVVKVAEERIRAALVFDLSSTITLSKLEKQSGLRKLEATLKLPDNTPND